MNPLSSNWDEIAQRSLAGEIAPEHALSVLTAPSTDLLAMLHASYRVRYQAFGNTVQLYYLLNAKSGLCPEDCHYCSQSKVSTASIPRYPLMSKGEILEAAARANDLRACTFCIVASGRSPAEHELDHVIDAVVEVKRRYNMRICCCLGILKDGQAQKLAAAGVERFNHNLNTSEAYHSEVCTTHTFAERVATVQKVKDAGISPCCGGIVGMGESDEDIVSMAFSLRDLGSESIPVNFYHPVAGTPFQGHNYLTPTKCLAVLAMFRFVNPKAEIRIAGGRELHLRSLQPMGLYPANSIFVSDYLTTEGQPADVDFGIIEDLGFEIVTLSTATTG